MKLTEEQQKILQAPLSRGKIYAVLAYAGAGKTFILQKIAEKALRERPKSKILYMAFNKAIQVEARSKFPRNVTVKTTHSLAWSAVGRDYSKKLGNIRPYMLMEYADIPKRVLQTDSWGKLNCALYTLNNWLYSEDEIIMPKHVAMTYFNTCSDPEFRKTDAVGMAQHIWNKCLDKDSRLPMPHDGYLKLYQLSKPKLNYDIILLDEAQDLNPVTLSLIMQQQHACRIFVGDPHQQIYEWRGSINAFENLGRPDKVFRLSQSFRFGDGIAEAASRMLKLYKQESIAVVGASGEESNVRKEPVPLNGNVQCAALFRTNGMLFSAAVELAKQGLKLNIIGGLNHSNFDDLWNVYYLHAEQPEKIKNFFVRRHNNVDHLAAYASAAEDHIMAIACKIIKKFGDSFPEYYKLLEKNYDSDSNIILSTVHKAKGLEFDHVNIKDDFIFLSPEKREDGIRYSQVITAEESNLIYVAITRAKQSLYIDELLNDDLKIIQHKEEEDESL